MTAPYANYGLVFYGGKMRYFQRVRVLRSDAKKGDVEIYLLDGSRVRVFAEEAVRRWPEDVKFEQEN